MTRSWTPGLSALPCRDGALDLDRQSNDAARRPKCEVAMNVAAQFRDLGVSLSGHVATVEIRRPPHNYFDNALIRAIAEAFDALDADPQCRAIVLAAEGK